MDFIDPISMFFFILILPVLLFLLISHRQIIKKRKILNLETSSKLKVFYSVLMKISILFLLILVLCRPYFGFHDVKITGQGSDNLILFDISHSMLSKDISPSRLQVAKRKVLDLLSILRENSVRNRVGIVLFAGQAYLYCPLTQDYGAVKQFLKTIHPNLISAQGSGLNAAIDSAIATMKRSNLSNLRLFLFSDGEDLGFNLEEAVTALKQNSLSALSLGFGTTSGAPIENENGEFIKDLKGNIVISKLNEENLTQLSQKSDGLYRKATVSDIDLRELLKSSLSSHTKNLTNNQRVENYRIYNELGPWILLLALCIFALLVLLGRREFVFSLLTMLLFQNIAWSEPATLFESHRLYEKGEFEKAKEGFEHSWKLNPSDPYITQSLASTYYKLADFEKAKELFKIYQNQAKTGKQKYEGHYNLGNAELMSNNYNNAITEYLEALKIKTGDKETEFNLNLAKALLKEEQEKEDQKQEESKDDPKDNSQNSDNHDQKSNPEDRKENNNPNDKEGSPSENQQNKKTNEKLNSDQQPTPQDNSDKEEKNSQKGNPQDNSENQESKMKTEKDAPQESSPMNNKDNADPSSQKIKSISEAEAHDWLESLPQSPVLVQRKGQPLRSRTAQTW